MSLPIWDDKDGWHAPTKNLYRLGEDGEELFDDQMATQHLYCLIYPSLTNELDEWLGAEDEEHQRTVMGALVSVDATIHCVVLTFKHYGEVRRYATELRPVRTAKEDD